MTLLYRTVATRLRYATASRTRHAYTLTFVCGEIKFGSPRHISTSLMYKILITVAEIGEGYGEIQITTKTTPWR